MLGLSLLLHASLIEFIRTGSKIWHQEFWNNDVNSLPSFIGSLFTGVFVMISWQWQSSQLPIFSQFTHI